MMKNYICFLPIILLFFSCSKENMSNETRDIRLKATVEASTAVSTKSVAASPYFDSSSGLKTSVWFSTIDGVYEDNPSPAAPTYIPYHAQVEYASDGMATVYKAKCHVLNRYVAVKVLRDEFTTDEEFVKRFNTEAQSAASITHPNKKCHPCE